MRIELLVRNGEELPGPAGRSLPLLTIQGTTHVRQPVWRHLALVNDATAGTVTTYLDYAPLAT